MQRVGQRSLQCMAFLLKCQYRINVWQEWTLMLIHLRILEILSLNSLFLLSSSSQRLSNNSPRHLRNLLSLSLKQISSIIRVNHRKQLIPSMHFKHLFLKYCNSNSRCSQCSSSQCSSSHCSSSNNLLILSLPSAFLNRPLLNPRHSLSPKLSNSNLPSQSSLLSKLLHSLSNKLPVPIPSLHSQAKASLKNPLPLLKWPITNQSELIKLKLRSNNSSLKWWTFSQQTQDRSPKCQMGNNKSLQWWAKSKLSWQVSMFKTPLKSFPLLLHLLNPNSSKSNKTLSTLIRTR